MVWNQKYHKILEFLMWHNQKRVGRAAKIENEIKFDEMYQKAFGTEVSEKRKERLKNEEKIDRKFYSKTSKK